MGDQPNERPSTYAGQHNTEKCGHTSIPLVGFESMIPVFEWPKTVCASDHLAIGTGSDYRKNLDIMKELTAQPITEFTESYRSYWTYQVLQMPHSKFSVTNQKDEDLWEDPPKF
jgi:hypothetical protein